MGVQFEFLHRKMERISDVYVQFEEFRCFFLIFHIKS